MSGSGDVPRGAQTGQTGAHERIHERDAETTRLMLQADRILARLMRDEDQAAGRDAQVGQAPQVLRSAERALARARRLARRAARPGRDAAPSERSYDAEVGALTSALDALVDDRRQGGLLAVCEKLVATCRDQTRERQHDLTELRTLAAEVHQLGRALEPAGGSEAAQRLEALDAALAEAQPAVLVPKAEAVLHDLTTVLRRRQHSDQSEAQRLHGEIQALRRTLGEVEAERAQAVANCAQLAEQEATGRVRRDRLLATIPLLRTAVQLNQGAIEMASGEIAAASARIAVMDEDRTAHGERRALAEEEQQDLQERLRHAHERSMALRQHLDQLSLALSANPDHAALVQEQQLTAQELDAAREHMRDLLERSVLSRRDAERAEIAADQLTRAMEQARAALRSSQRRLAELTVRCRALGEECDRLQAEVGSAATAHHEPPVRPATATLPAVPSSTRRRKRRLTASDGPVPLIDEVEPTWVDDPARQPGEGPSTWGGGMRADESASDANAVSSPQPHGLVIAPPTVPPVVRPAVPFVLLDPWAEAGSAEPPPQVEAAAAGQPENAHAETPQESSAVGDESSDLSPAIAPTTSVAAITRRVLPSHGGGTPRPVLRLETYDPGTAPAFRPVIPAVILGQAPTVERDETETTWMLTPALKLLLAAIVAVLLLLAVLATLVLAERVRDEAMILSAATAMPGAVAAPTTALPLSLREHFTCNPPDSSISDDGSARLDGGTLVATGQAALADAVMASGDFTLDMHLRAASTDVPEPACLLSWAVSSQERNLAIVQHGSALEVRLHTTATAPDGSRPHLVTGPGVITSGDQHLVLQRQGDQLSLRLDGATVATAIIPGALTVWTRTAPLVLGGERNAAGTWKGVVSAVVIRVDGRAEAGR